MFIIENDELRVSVALHGAELQSIQDKATGQEYMWNADSVWAKHSPILFPIVGVLKNNSYYYQGKQYHLSRHGFAREMDFTLKDQAADFLSLQLSCNETTLANYPFPFELYIEYRLDGTSLKVTYTVINTGNDSMYFSIGGHPAFKVPLFAGDNYNDYQLEFNEKETTGRWLINEEGLQKGGSVPLLEDTKHLPLQKELFFADAIVLKQLQSNRVKLVSKQSGNGFQFDFIGFPYLGIWAAKGADFVCIEPWCGVADSVDSDQQLTNKEGINVLRPSGVFERSWQFSLIK